MPEQNHHLATHYGAWGVEFQGIADIYGLSVENGTDWNVLRIPHRGPHPAEYHQWVLDNMQLIHEIAQGDVATFKSLFEQWVTNVVRDDETIVRVAYWKCHRT